MTLDEQIAILQAAKEGKAIEWMPKIANQGSPWGTIKNDVEFNFHDFFYRIKQEPREFWAIDDGSKYMPIFFSSEEDSNSYCNQHKGIYRQFKVREVIE